MRSPHIAMKSSPLSSQLEKARTQQRRPNTAKNKGIKKKKKKSLAFLNTNDEISESEIKATLPFIIATKRIKYVGINLHEETKDLYAENCKKLMKKNKAKLS